MKKIDVILEFLNNDEADCLNSTKNLSCFLGRLFSYGQVIAIKGNRDNKILVNSRKYSVTSSQHRNLLVREAQKRGFEIVFTTVIHKVLAWNFNTSRIEDEDLSTRFED
jgi:hypothetical protein